MITLYHFRIHLSQLDLLVCVCGTVGALLLRYKENLVSCFGLSYLVVLHATQNWQYTMLRLHWTSRVSENNTRDQRFDLHF